MKRVPASLAVLLLHQEADARALDGDAEGAARLRVRPATLRKWVQRGHITRGPGGYDLGEILTYLEQRERSTSVDDLITWLRAQIDEDERAAQKAWGAEWRAELQEPRQHIVTVGASQVQDGVSVASGAPAVLPHIAAHSPARVLREVEAKRRIIASELSPYPEAAHADVATVTLRLLALPYADRPGYREEWRPL